MSLEDHTPTDRTDHDAAKRAIATALQNDARGRDSAISGASLAERTPVSASTTRDLIAEVRREYGLPVASCSDGYFVVETADELAEVVDRIDRTIATKRERKRELTAAYNRRRVDR